MVGNRFLTMCGAALLPMLLWGCGGGPSKKVRQANVHRRVGETYLSQMKISQALAEFQKGLEINPKDPELQHDMGLSFLLREEFDKAETYLNRALELDASLSEARNHLAIVYLAQKRPAEAIEQLNKALGDKEFASVGKAYFNLGKAYVQTEQINEAVKSFESSIERAPSDIRPYLELASLYLQISKPDKAVFCMHRALEFYPNDYRAWFLLGRALQAKNDRKGAIGAFQNTRRNAPETSEEFIRAGSFLKLLGE